MLGGSFLTYVCCLMYVCPCTFHLVKKLLDVISTCVCMHEVMNARACLWAYSIQFVFSCIFCVSRMNRPISMLSSFSKHKWSALRDTHGCKECSHVYLSRRQILQHSHVCGLCSIPDVAFATWIREFWAISCWQLTVFPLLRVAITQVPACGMRIRHSAHFVDVLRT